MYNTCLTSSPEYSYFFLQIDDAIACPIASLLKALRILEDLNYYICSCYTTHSDLIFQSFHLLTITCVKRVRIRSYSGPHFSRIFQRIRTEYEEIRSISPYSVQMWENPGKMRTIITPKTDSFYAV